MADGKLTKVFLIPAGSTAWQRDDRVQGNTDLPVADPDALDEAVPSRWPPSSIKAVVCGPDEASRQTAKHLAKPSRARVRVVDDLAEMNLGLWQGLRRDELKDRYPKVFSQWRNDPYAVSIPSGETMPQVEARLRKALTRTLEKANGSPIVLVLRPLVHSLAVRMLDSGDMAAWREQDPADASVAEIELDTDRWLEQQTPPRRKRSKS